jgi:aerobic-type carbon monoxide dehydrogenase small subunit (CoxS/CutS family)
MGAYILLSELENKPIHKNQIEEAILRVVGEHICRCTGYAKYHEAIREVILNTPGLLIADK